MEKYGARATGKVRSTWKWKTAEHEASGKVRSTWKWKTAEHVKVKRYGARGIGKVLTQRVEKDAYI